MDDPIQLRFSAQRFNLTTNSARNDAKGFFMSVRPQTKDKPAAASFQWDDPFLLDDQLTEDERLIRDTARAYAQDKLLPRVIKAYLEEKTDREIGLDHP